MPPSRSGPIVLATDYSEASAAAARAALRLAPRPQDIIVVHAALADTAPGFAGSPGLGAITVPVETLAPPALVDETLAWRELETWSAEHGLAEARHLIVHGPPGAALARVADEECAKLIVMGATGRSRIERVLLGSTATSVLHDAPCAVLLVRGEPEAFSRVVVGLDLSGENDLARRAGEALRATLRDASDVTLVHVRDQTLRGAALEPHEAETHLAAVNRTHFGGRAHLVTAMGRPAEEIARAALDHHADIVVVGDHGDGGALERLLIGSVTNRLAERAPCSLLVLKRQEPEDDSAGPG